MRSSIREPDHSMQQCTNTRRIDLEIPRCRSPSHFLPVPGHCYPWVPQTFHRDQMERYSNTQAQTATDSALGLRRPSGPFLFALYPQQQGILLPHSHARAHYIQEWWPHYFDAHGTRLFEQKVGNVSAVRNLGTHRSFRYTTLQVVSVVLVTLGVVLTTLSGAKKSKAGINANSMPGVGDISQYLTGIAVLSAGLVLSGLLGVVQDRTYSKFRRRGDAPWEESMFYLHFLSMPIFLPLKSAMVEQFYTLQQPSAFSTSSLPFPSPIPIAFFILGLNVFTQLICAAGVNRLTSRVSSLTVNLTLVVRKAVSLVISLTLFGDKKMDGRQISLLYGGAGLVFLGTVLYPIAQKRKKVD